MDNIELLVDSAKGIYIPQYFVKHYILDRYNMENVDPESITSCLNGPDDEHYWESWADILVNTTFECEGKTYYLHHDGDLLIVAWDELTDQHVLTGVSEL